LWFAFGVVGAAVAGENYFFVGVQVHGSELASADAPAAAVAFVFVDADDSSVLLLRECVFGARSYARGVFTVPAGDSEVV
jgi:hypothetical protein